MRLQPRGLGDSWWRRRLLWLTVCLPLLGVSCGGSGVGKNGVSALSRSVADLDIATSYSAFNISYKVTQWKHSLPSLNYTHTRGDHPEATSLSYKDGL